MDGERRRVEVGRGSEVAHRPWVPKQNRVQSRKGLRYYVDIDVMNSHQHAFKYLVVFSFVMFFAIIRMPNPFPEPAICPLYIIINRETTFRPLSHPRLRQQWGLGDPYLANCG